MVETGTKRLETSPVSWRKVHSGTPREFIFAFTLEYSGGEFLVSKRDVINQSRGGNKGNTQMTASCSISCTRRWSVGTP